MDMTGERIIAAPRERVWAALNDAQALKAAIPGCEAMDKTSDTELTARVAMKIGPMAARFTVKVTLSDIDPPESYQITGEGNGGAMGFAKGGAEVRLTALGPSETRLNYSAKAQVGGKMAQLGARLIDATAKQMSDQFFDRFAAALAPAPAAEAAGSTPMPAAQALSILSLIPKEFAGMPIIFWVGSFLMLWVMYLIFLST